MSGASQDFRDGAATGAAAIAKRARTLISWGLPIDDRLLDKLAEQVVYEMGGSVYPLDSADEFDAAQAWDEGFTARSVEEEKQRLDPMHYPITRNNPYHQ